MIMTVYGRFFKLYLYTAIAPVPLSTFAGEPTQNVGKSFIKSYAAVSVWKGPSLCWPALSFPCLRRPRLPLTPMRRQSPRCGAISGSWSLICLVLVGAVKMADRVVREMMGL